MIIVFLRKPGMQLFEGKSQPAGSHYGSWPVFLNSPRLPRVIEEKVELPIDYRTIGNYNRFGPLKNRCSSEWRNGRVRDSVGEPEEDKRSCGYAGSVLYRMMYDIILKGGRAFR